MVTVALASLGQIAFKTLEEIDAGKPFDPELKLIAGWA